MKKIILILLMMFFGEICVSQSFHGYSDTNFVYKITSDIYACRDCDYNDYMLVVKIRYKDTIHVVVVSYKYLRFYCCKYLKICNNTQQYIRNILLNDKIIEIETNNIDVLNGFLDTNYECNVIDIQNNKELFLNYYFNKNKQMKIKIKSQLNINKNTLHSISYESAYVIKKLAEWGIPTYCSVKSSSNVYELSYGYYN